MRLALLATLWRGASTLSAPRQSSVARSVAVAARIDDVVRTARTAARSCAALGIALSLATAAPQVTCAAAAFTAEQRLAAEAWHETDHLFFDRTFNGVDWFGERTGLLKAKAADADAGRANVVAMIGRLGDKYTRYIAPDAYERLVAATLGDAAFVAGAGVQMVDGLEGAVDVVDVEPGAPADEAGLRAGDRILAVAGFGVADGAGAARAFRGEAGTQVTVSFARNGDVANPIKATINRRIVELSSVRVASVGSTDVIRIRNFAFDTPQKVSDLAPSVVSKRPLILDLRGNGGGSLEGGIGVARLFLKQGERVVTVVDKRGAPFTYDAVEDGALTSRRGVAPTLVLVDGNTASAAEVLTAALQQNKAATVFGAAHTFGKGVIQSVQPLGDPPGIDGAVAVTVAKYVTPSGDDINGRGVLADAVVVCGFGDSAADCLKRAPGTLLATSN
ncbi:ClpP/crotonase-like domain-containing protein [Pelagophyceae sp. CCMP2097]|nr:ClpP/crotonase-like domain-containing protein [Pelagophyceae sp. CCMP2097]